MAKQRAIERVVLDDREARRCARALGLRVIGTLGIAGRAKERGLISRAAPLIFQLRQKGFYATDELVESLLNEIGEGERKRSFRLTNEPVEAPPLYGFGT